MHPFAIAALTLLAVTPIALLLGCVAAGEKSGDSPKVVALTVIDRYRRPRFERRHPGEVRVFADMGYYYVFEIARMRREGWTVSTIGTAFNAAEKWRNRTFTLRGAQPITRDAMRVLPANVVMAFIDVDCPLWMSDLKATRAWVQVAGVLAPLAIKAGLSLNEARDLAAEDRLTRESLAVLVALQAPPAPTGDADIWNRMAA